MGRFNSFGFKQLKIVLILLFLLFGLNLVILLLVQTRRGFSCQDTFVVNSKGDKKTYTCGLINQTDQYYTYLARLERVYEKNDSVYGQVKVIEQNKATNFDVFLGKKNISYTWITIKNGKILYDIEGAQKWLQLKVDGTFLKKLSKPKDPYILFNISKSDSILKVNETTVNADYSADFKIRQNYQKDCNPTLKSTTNLSKIKASCGEIYAHSLTVFQSNLDF